MGKTVGKFYMDKLETKETKATKQYVEKRNKRFEERKDKHLECLRNVDFSDLDLGEEDE